MEKDVQRNLTRVLIRRKAVSFHLMTQHPLCNPDTLCSLAFIPVFHLFYFLWTPIHLEVLFIYSWYALSYLLRQYLSSISAS